MAALVCPQAPVFFFEKNQEKKIKNEGIQQVNLERKESPGSKNTLAI